MKWISAFFVAYTFLFYFSIRAPLVTAFQVTRPGVRPNTYKLGSIQSPTKLQYTLSAAKSQNEERTASTLYQYKDDCFGFLSFGAGAGTGDAIFAGTFVVLSLLAATATALKWLPVDPKRSTIVDRRVPGVVALLTLILASPVSPLSSILHTIVESILTNVELPEPASFAESVQLAVGAFSTVTSFADIRWRDRLDYPEEFRN